MLIVYTKLVIRRAPRVPRMFAWSDLADHGYGDETKPMDDCLIISYDYSVKHSIDDNHRFMAQAFCAHIKNNNPVSGGLKKYNDDIRKFMVKR